MRVVIDLQPLQTESRLRGIGRYTREVVKALLQQGSEHEILLIVSSMFPETIADLKTEFDNTDRGQRVLVWHAPGPVRAAYPQFNAQRQAAEAMWERFVGDLEPDVLLITGFFEGYVDDAVISISTLERRYPVAIIGYDLIPAAQPGLYLDPVPAYRDFYLEKLQNLQDAESILCISESTRSEWVNITAPPKHQDIRSISTGLSGEFRQIQISQAEKIAFKNKLSIDKPFVLNVGAADPRKNLSNLIAAFSKLPEPLRQEYQLVLCGPHNDNDRKLLRHTASSTGMKPEELIILNDVADEDLVKLYNLTDLFVMPSLHEGFGLPALEAMACGAPTIGSRLTSIPEVIGLPEALFDPNDTSDISHKICETLTNDKFRAEIVAHGLERAQKFTWENVAKTAVTALEDMSKAFSDRERQQGKWHDHLQSRYEDLLSKLAELTVEVPIQSPSHLVKISSCIAQNELTAIRAKSSNFSATERLTWQIEGPFDSSYSLALVNREFARGLAQLGVGVSLFSTEGPGDFDPSEQFLKDNPDVATLHKRAKSRDSNEPPVISSRNLFPPRVADLSGELRLLHCYGWEETGFPAEYVDDFNQYLDGITVMSNHVAKVLVSNGVTTPMAVVGIGTDHWERVEASAISPIQDTRPHSFKFLHVSSFFPRKGGDVLLQAWAEAFSSNDETVLIIKTFPNPHHDVAKDIAAFRSDHPTAAEIIVIDYDMSPEDLKRLYQDCDVMVAPSFAEGFCLPIAEGMVSGIPAITTAWSGQLDFCTPENSWLVDYDFERANSHLSTPWSLWAKPKSESLVAKLREARLSGQGEREEMARKGREKLLSEYSWQKVGERSLDFVRQLTEYQEGNEIRVGWVTTWQQPCGIASYSEHLLKQFSLHTHILTARNHSNSETFKFDHTPCWTEGSDDLRDLESVCRAQGVNTLVVQWNFGFFEPEAFNDWIQREREANVRVIIELHSTIDPPHAPGRALANYGPALAAADHLLVHNTGDINRLKTLGLEANASLFPLGVLDYVPLSHRPLKNFTLASFGFCLPNKGILELVAAFKELMDVGDTPYRLILMNAIHSDPSSIELSEKVRNLISEAGLRDHIDFDTQYISENEIVERLQQADLIVLPYGPSNESSSAAARMSIRTGVPVAVSDSKIFDDLGDSVWRLKASDPILLADEIVSLSRQVIEQTESFINLQNNARQWCDDRSFVTLAKRLGAIVTAESFISAPSPERH